jgi:hypothetical protein
MPTREPLVRLRKSVGGTWRSELGSELELHNVDGFLTGRFTSAVGTVRVAQPLIGLCTPSTGVGSVALGFVVRWADTMSLTSWTGRYESEGDDLNLTWVLEATAAAATRWRSTHVGQDRFHRSGPA